MPPMISQTQNSFMKASFWGTSLILEKAAWKHYFMTRAFHCVLFIRHLSKTYYVTGICFTLRTEKKDKTVPAHKGK